MRHKKQMMEIISKDKTPKGGSCKDDSPLEHDKLCPLAIRRSDIGDKKDNVGELIGILSSISERRNKK